MAREIWHEKEINEMLKVVSEANTIKDVEELFDMILTPREINDMARRYKAIEMLEKGLSYSEIGEALGLSSVIVSRLSNKIGYGFRRSSKIANKRTKAKNGYVKIAPSYKGMPAIKISR